MLKQADSTGDQAKRRKQVSLDMPPEVEEHLKKKAAEGFRSLSSEITMRLAHSVRAEIDAQTPASRAMPTPHKAAPVSHTDDRQ